MTPDELQQLRCVRRAGQEAEPDTVDRLLLTIANLERELLRSGQRSAHAMAMDAAKMSELCQRVVVLEAALGALAWNEVDGKCWCPESPELGAGTHAPACATARAALHISVRSDG